MNIFNLTERPQKQLFYSRNDPKDLKLGDFVKSSPEEFEDSQVIILGSPQDEGVKRNRGREGAKDAPDEIRKAFYKLSLNDKISSKKVFDLGNLKVDSSLENIHKNQEFVVSEILKTADKIIILGGGNDISYPDCKALSLAKESILAINIDSHFDVRDDKPRNSGTPYRMLLDEKLILPNNFFEIGIKPFASSPVYENYLKEIGVEFFTINKVKESGIKKILDSILMKNKSKFIFWGFDMDSVRAFAAPGVSAPNPNGLTAEEAITAAETAGIEDRTKIFEISEVNPKFDIDGRTCKLAAVMMWHFISCL